jgi:hypothetical protein
MTGTSPNRIRNRRSRNRSHHGNGICRRIHGIHNGRRSARIRIW